MSWTLKLLVIVLPIAAKGVIQVHPMMRLGDECGIEMRSRCSDGKQEEHELTLNGRPIAIWEVGKPLNCIEPCIKQEDHILRLNCTSVKNKTVKYTFRCLENGTMEESFNYFRDHQELLSPFPNLTTVAPTFQADWNKHIGLGVSSAVMAGVILFWVFMAKCKKQPATISNV